MVKDPEWRNNTAEGCEQIAAAYTLLRTSGEPPRRRLHQAGLLFWKALFHRETWPELLRSHAAAVMALLFRYGPIDTTVARMADEDVADALRQLEGFCREFLHDDPQP